MAKHPLALVCRPKKADRFHCAHSSQCAEQRIWSPTSQVSELHRQAPQARLIVNPAGSFHPCQTSVHTPDGVVERTVRKGAAGFEAAPADKAANQKQRNGNEAKNTKPE